MIDTEILFTGYYGMKNTGDDAFVEVAAWGAQKYWNKNNNRFLGPNYLLPTTIVPAKGFPVSIPRSYDFQRSILIKNTDYLISAGGSTIHSELKSGNIKSIALDLKQKFNKLKIGAIGVSLGPFKTIKDESSIKKYLQKIDFLAVRDQRSYDFASALQLPYKPVNAFDLAALLPEIYQPKTLDIENSIRKIVGISICPVESVHGGEDLDNEKRRNAKIVELIKTLDKRDDILFRFFIINGNDRNGDLHLTNEIINASNPKNFEVINYQRETKKMWSSVASCDFVLATRLHAAIFACFAEIPFMLIEYHKKCTDFLNNVGYSSSVMIGDAEFETIVTADTISSWVDHKNNFPIPTYLSEMIQKAFLNFTDIKI